MLHRCFGYIALGFAICTPPAVHGLRFEDAVGAGLANEDALQAEFAANKTNLTTDLIKRASGKKLGVGKNAEDGCTCDAEYEEDDKGWAKDAEGKCFCPEDADCEWNDEEGQICETVASRAFVTMAQSDELGVGNLDERVPVGAARHYNGHADGTADSDDEVIVVDFFPIISQNTLDADDGGEHACWAVARASAAKFTTKCLKPEQGPKTEAERLYAKSGETTGWFAPDSMMVPAKLKDFPLQSHIKPFHGISGATPIASTAKAIAEALQNGNIITVAMAKIDCKSTFHYVTVVGIGVKAGSEMKVSDWRSWDDDFVLSQVEIFVSDAWCPGYAGRPFFTKRNQKELGEISTDREKDDKTEYTLETHPCIHKAHIQKPHTWVVTKDGVNYQIPDPVRKGVKGVVSLWLDNLQYADGPRCMFKMWEVGKDCMPDYWRLKECKKKRSV